ncbi:MAG TPA: hypothetical protein VMT22_16740 [Terriglobales bacterium]|jgi:chromosome segregation ATPase|nr:hypothetical protein [Terriglobales bacterium]
MSKIYEALNELESNPFDAQNAALCTRVSPSNTPSICSELAEIEKLFVERIDRLRATADEAERSVASERQRVAQTIETLKDQIRALEIRLKETSDILERKELANQALERDLNARIDEFQIASTKQDEVLKSRASEVIALKSEVNRLKNGIQAMVSAVSHHAQALAENPAENLSPPAIAAPAMIAAERPMSSQVGASTNPSVGTGPDSNTVPSTFER